MATGCAHEEPNEQRRMDAKRNSAAKAREMALNQTTHGIGHIIEACEKGRVTQSSALFWIAVFILATGFW